MAAMSATRQTVLFLYFTLKFPCSGAGGVGCTVEVGTTLCADEGMMVMFWVGITVVL